MTRIFLVANGPSLQRTDLDQLIGEEAWGLARIHLIYDQTDWRPTRFYWSDYPQNARDMQDILWHMEQGYECWYRRDVCEIIEGKHRVGSPNPPGTHTFRPADWNPEPRTLPDHVHPWDYCHDHNAGFTRNMDGSPDYRRPQGWHDGPLCKYGSGFNVMLQQAAREGYNPIYLVGADLGFRGRDKGAPDWNHFSNDYHERLVESERAAIDNETHVDFHTHARDWCEAKGIYIFNATLGGELEVYPRIDWNMLWR